MNFPKGVKSGVKSRSFNLQWVVFHKLLIYYMSYISETNLGHPTTFEFTS